MFPNAQVVVPATAWDVWHNVLDGAVYLHKGFLDLSVGKQYVFCGQTDWVNPTDLFTPWDYVNISSELEDYRVAPWAIRATAARCFPASG